MYLKPLSYVPKTTLLCTNTCLTNGKSGSYKLCNILYITNILMDIFYIFHILGKQKSGFIGFCSIFGKQKSGFYFFK